MTRHLVLTTLHTHNAASSIARLGDMGIEPTLLAPSINCIVAQLARRLCVPCREPYWAEEQELDELGIDPSIDTRLYAPPAACSARAPASRAASRSTK